MQAQAVAQAVAPVMSNCECLWDLQTSCQPTLHRSCFISDLSSLQASRQGPGEGQAASQESHSSCLTCINRQSGCALHAADLQHIQHTRPSAEAPSSHAALRLTLCQRLRQSRQAVGARREAPGHRAVRQVSQRVADGAQLPVEHSYHSVSPGSVQHHIVHPARGCIACLSHTG